MTTCLPHTTAHDVHFNNILAATRGRSNHYFSFATWPIGVGTPRAGTSIIGFEDNALLVCAAEDVRILELRISESLWRAKLWLDSKGMKMALKNRGFARHGQEILSVPEDCLRGT